MSESAVDERAAAPHPTATPAHRVALPRVLPLPVASPIVLASGIALDLAFPGIGWWPLAIVGVAGLAVAVRGRRAPIGALLGLVCGFAFFAPHLHWAGVYVGTFPWMALAIFESLYFALLGAALPSAWRAPGGRLGTVAAVAGLWVAQEALRGRAPYGGFPWGRLAFSQSDAPTLGYASIGGAPLVTAMVAAGGAALAVAAVGAADYTAQRHLAGRGASSPRALLTAVVGLTGCIALIGGGALVPRPTSSARSAEVAAVQGNVPSAGLEFNARRRAVLDNHVQATRQLADRVAGGQTAQPDVVLWPENSSDIDPLRNPDAAEAISSAASAIKVPVLVGAVLDQPANHLSNAGMLWIPNGTGSAVPGPQYIKRHPAPFAEYIPSRAFFRNFSDKVDLVREDFVAGSSVGVLPAGQVTLGDVICFEVAYDSLVQDPVREGANLLVVQTNNATFGYTDESIQQLAMSRLRAVETGRAVVHISTVGVSALILPDGSMTATSGHFTQQVLTGRLPLRTEQTLAVRLNGVPDVALAGCGLLLAALGGLRGRQARRQTISAVTIPSKGP